MPVLVEREDQLSLIDQALRASGSGRSAPVLVTGEVGSGKSELLRAACRAAAVRGMKVLSVRASPAETSEPLAVARRLLGQHVRAEPSGVAAVVRQVVGLGARHDAGLVLAVDDLPSCDLETLRLLALLVDAPRDARVAVLLSAGTADPGAHAEAVAQVCGHPRLTHVRTAPLSADGVEQALRASSERWLPKARLPDVARACHEVTAGNPFLLWELLDALRSTDHDDPVAAVHDTVPERVARSVHARLTALPADARLLANAVAVLGPGATLGEASGLAEVPPDRAAACAERLVAAEVLDDGVDLSFRQPLLASAVLEGLGALAAANLHRRAAAVLTHHGAGAVRVGTHLLHSARAADATVVDALHAAAGAAAAAGELPGAIAFLRRALAEPPTARQRSALVLDLARLEAEAGEAAASERLAEALTLTDDRSERIVALRELSRLQFTRQRLPEAAATIQQAMAEADPADPVTSDLTAEFFAAVTFSGQDIDAETRADFDRRILRLLQDHAEGRLPDHPALMLQVASILAGARGPRADVVPLMTRTIEHGALHELPPYGFASTWAVLTLVAVDDVDLALEVAEEAYATALGNGSVLRLGNAVYSLAAAHSAAGLLERAEVECKRSLQLARNGVPSTLVYSAALLANVRQERGDLAGARRALAAGERTGEHGLSHGILLHHRGRIALAEGDPEQAWEVAMRARDHLTSFGLRDYPLAPWRLVAGFAAHALGREDEAQQLVGRELDLARRAGAAAPIARALQCLALLSPLPQRLALLGEALELLAGSGDQVRRAHVTAALGLAEADSGGSRARQLLLDAHDLARRCGAAPLARSTRAALRDLGARPRATVAAGEPLTTAERRTAELAGQGLTNRAIAETLSLTVSTVEFHLSRVYRKLGIRSRRQLAEHLA